ncbi:MAG TPA: hypothetical protein VKA15_13120, partial [Isosphaeraceae bacterium]|nr:hypothetical protein [Isosphaeraceae bacterium]
IFRETCRDVLRIDAIKIIREGAPAAATWLDEIIDRFCPSGKTVPSSRLVAPRGSTANRLVAKGNGLFQPDGNHRREDALPIN